MKKIFYLASIAALALSSCAKDETTGAIVAVNGGKITAAVEADDTRTYLENVDGKYQFRWKATDALYVYGDTEHPLPGETFTIGEGAETATAVFTGVTLKEDVKYVATYPAKTSVKPVWDVEVKNAAGEIVDYALDPKTVKMSIPAEQNYKPGSFDTGVAPAISKSFVVDADGNAQVSMQPVADYLFVNIVGTKPINTLTLQLWNGDSNHTSLNIAGASALKTYTYNKATRYYLSNENMTEDKIVLNAVANPEIECHEANTYVFTIPAGILGMDKNIEAVLFVDGSDKFTFGALTEKSLNPTSPVAGQTRISNALLNYKTKKVNGVNTRYGRTSTNTNGDTVYDMPMENTVFWMNPMVDTDGDGAVDSRGAFVYNPDDDVIIRNQVDLLKYFYDYNAGTKANAFVCNETEFDFSAKALNELATTLRKTEGEAAAEAANELINDYAAFGFPSIDDTYSNKFTGNGAVISNVKLSDGAGIFGKLTNKAEISGITFDNIKAKDIEQKYTDAAGKEQKGIVGGFIIGQGLNSAKTIEDVVVSNAVGMAITNIADNDVLAGMTITGISGLDYIFSQMNLNDDLDLTEDWANLTGTKQNAVFGKLLVDTAAEDKHHVVTLPKGANYANLASYVGINANTRIALVNPDYVPAETLDQRGDGDDAISVLIDGVSYWTGYTINTDTAVGGTGANKTYTKIEFAEQLAGASTDNAKVYVTRNMNLNFDNNQKHWSSVTLNELVGGGNTISGFVMEETDGKPVAPFALSSASNVVLDGVQINVVTEQNNVAVPEKIAGLSLSADNVTGVTLNNLNINASVKNGKGNSVQYDNQPIVGWLVASANDIQIHDSVVNGVKTNLTQALAGLVGQLALDNNNAQLWKNTVSNVSASGLKKITSIKQYDSEEDWAVYSDTVASVVANENVTVKSVGISFEGQTPAFYFDSETPIVVWNKTTDKYTTYVNEE